MFILIFSAVTQADAQLTTARIKIVFKHQANNKILVPGDSSYINDFGEKYQVTKFRYYISNVDFGSGSKNVQLIDVAGQDSIMISVKPGRYDQFSFVLGVDSLLNCRGAQSGALDPLNGMFWTWNSGYIFFKLEGYSASSAADLHRIEHHIGGYKDLNKVAAKVTIPMPKTLIVKANETATITIDVNLDKYWNGKNKLSIAEHPLIMVPGELAKKAAANFAGMFSIEQ